MSARDAVVISAGFARLFAEKLCFSGGGLTSSAATPPRARRQSLQSLREANGEAQLNRTSSGKAARHMKPLTKIYASIAAAVLLTVTITWLWSTHKIAKLEGESRDARQRADALEQHAAQRETEAGQYKQKIEYLEQQLAAIQQIAIQQNEELDKLNSISNRARADVERARRTKSVAASADQLCQELADLGHPCQ